MSLAGIRRLKIANVEDHYDKEYPPEFFPFDVRRDLKKCSARAIQGESCSIESLAHDTNGEKVWFSTTFIPVFDETKSIVKFVIASSVDITNEVEHRRHLEKLVEDRTREKLEVQQHLFHAQKTGAIENLAAGIAHDFNNVLEMILASVELQRFYMENNSSSAEKLNRCFDSIENATARASELSNQLIGFAKKGKYAAKPVNVNRLIEEFTELLKLGLHWNKKIEIETALKSVNFVEADAVQLQQVIQNLVVNSRDAMPMGGEITIQTSDVFIDADQLLSGNKMPRGNYVKISVSDTGSGIEPEIMANIFDPYFTTKSRESGTGLGLACVWGIVQNHQGFLDVRSEPNVSTVFDIYFPAIEPIAELETTSQHGFSDSLAIKVLVVDDEIAIRKLLKEYLSEIGSEVIVASNGEEALDVYKSQRPDLVITDLVMDSMDGLQLYYEIRRIDPQANVYLMSGYEEDEKVNEAIADGALGLLKKPFGFKKLMKAVKIVSHAAAMKSV